MKEEASQTLWLVTNLNCIYEFIKTKYVSAFGYEHAETWSILDTANWLLRTVDFLGRNFFVKQGFHGIANFTGFPFCAFINPFG